MKYMTLLASSSSFGDAEISPIVGIVGIIVWLIVLIICFIIPMMKMFTKAGKPSWAVFVPIYNNYIMYEIVFPGKGLIKLLLTCIPFVNIFIVLHMLFKLPTVYGKSWAWSLLMFTPASLFLLWIISGGEYIYNGYGYSNSTLPIYGNQGEQQQYNNGYGQQQYNNGYGQQQYNNGYGQQQYNQR